MTVTRILLNYSHPLTERARAALQEMTGSSVTERLIACQLDMEQPLLPQLDALVTQAGQFDLLIPPSLSYAAAYVTARLSMAQSDAWPPVPPRMVILRREGPLGGYMPSEIV